MQRDDIALENALARTIPSRLNARLLDRLTRVLDSASAPVSAVDEDFVEMLSSRQPAAMSEPLMSRLASLADAASAAIDMPRAEKVVPFRRYAAAAAIALAGAVAALLAPINRNPPAVAEQEAPATSGFSGNTRGFVPAAYERGLSDARTEGVIWRDNAPHRVLRIVYTDTITLRNEAGETVEVEQPRVEYIVVPEIPAANR